MRFGAPGLILNNTCEKEREFARELGAVRADQTGMTNKEIGGFVGGLSYSGVTRVAERFIDKVKKNRASKRDLEAIPRKMSRVNGLLPKPLGELQPS